MVGLFKYLFYRIYWWNTSVIKNESYPIFGAIVGVSFFQLFNIKFISDFILYEVLDRRDLVVNQTKAVGIAIVTLVLIINGLFYNKHGQGMIDKVKKFKKPLRRKKDIVTIIYILITLVSTISLAYIIRNNY